MLPSLAYSFTSALYHEAKVIAMQWSQTERNTQLSTPRLTPLHARRPGCNSQPGFILGDIHCRALPYPARLGFRKRPLRSTHAKRPVTCRQLHTGAPVCVSGSLAYSASKRTDACKIEHRYIARPVTSQLPELHTPLTGCCIRRRMQAQRCLFFEQKWDTSSATHPVGYLISTLCRYYSAAVAGCQISTGFTPVLCCCATTVPLLQRYCNTFVPLLQEHFSFLCYLLYIFLSARFCAVIYKCPAPLRREAQLNVALWFSIGCRRDCCSINPPPISGGGINAQAYASCRVKVKVVTPS